MEKQKINWLELTESEKAKLLIQIKAHLIEQVEDGIVAKSLMEALCNHEST